MQEQVSLPSKSLNFRCFVSATIAAILFGISGNVAQVLFEHHITPLWLAAFRTLVVGVLLYALLRPPFPRKHILLFFLYAIVGFIGVQICFYLTIANATFYHFCRSTDRNRGVWRSASRSHRRGFLSSAWILSGMENSAILILPHAY